MPADAGAAFIESIEIKVIENNASNMETTVRAFGF
jgi:hypothetical protein